MKITGSSSADIEALRKSGLVDEKWYLEKYPDVKALGMDPVTHYVWLGARLGRDPNPRFSTNGYLAKYADVSRLQINPLLHYFRWGKRENRSPTARDNIFIDETRPYKTISGGVKYNDDAPTVMVVAHTAGENLFGSERSYLDILDGLNSNGINVVSILPSDDFNYTIDVLARSNRLFILRYGWWKNSSPISERTVGIFQKIINEVNADAVHVNTIMLREPLIAAKREGVTSLCHVRELIWHDKWLAELIGEAPQRIVETVNTNSDWIIANSKTTANSFLQDGKTFVIENTVDTDMLDIDNKIDDSINFGIISSNIKKKGILDFISVARICENEAVRAKFVIIGPETDLIRDVKGQRVYGKVPSNVEFAGYAASPLEAVRQVNVVLSLSHFAESFGRTVLEAMAARRPVIAYKWGAVPELIEHGQTGLLVEYKNPSDAARAVITMCRTPGAVERMGVAARRIAVEKYSKARYAKVLGEFYEDVFERSRNNISIRQRYLDGSSSEIAEGNDSIRVDVASRDDSPQIADVSVIVPNYNYERYLEERLNSILSQTVKPRQIIFLDDFSSDGSVNLARNILQEGSIPFEIIENTRNEGTYPQWLKGIQRAVGKFIWIAEADDTCSPSMLAVLLNLMGKDDSIAIAYCQSRRIDEDGQETAPHNRHHTDDLDSERWKHDYVELGLREVVDYLLYRNTIPNVSACLLRKDSVSGIEKMMVRLRFGGDHLLYCHMLKFGGIAYSSQPLNGFRRHSASVTRSGLRSIDFLQEVAEVRSYICQNFPVHESQIQKMTLFLDKDYKIGATTKNSEEPIVKAMLTVSREQVIKNRRIVLLTTNNGSYTGGSEMLWRDAAMRMREEGHDVVVVIKKWEPEPPFEASFRRAGIKFIYKGENELSSIYNFNPDLVVISTGDQDEGIEYFSNLKQKGIKYVIINQLTKQREYWPVRAERTGPVRAGYANAETVFFTCRNNHRVMEDRIEGKIINWELVFNPIGIDINTKVPFPDIERGIHLALPARLLKIHKGQHLAIDVISKRKWRDRKVTLNLYGEGPDKADLEKQVARLGLESVLFHPRVPDMTEIWRLNHGILMPSFMEGLPIVLTGAMVAGRVPIVTDIGGHAEVIEDNYSGFLARFPTVEDVDDAMERAFHRVHEWEEIGKRARMSILDFLPADPTRDFVQRILRIASGLRPQSPPA